MRSHANTSTQTSVPASSEGRRSESADTPISFADNPASQYSTGGLYTA